MKELDDEIQAAVEALAEFADELPTIRCGEGGCNACNAAFIRACEPLLPGPAEPKDVWEEDTKPQMPLFLADTPADGVPMVTFDDDYFVMEELGGEGG